jgi:hypothetical protein
MIDIIAEFRALPAEEQRSILAELSRGKRGRPRKDGEAALIEAMALIERVERVANPGTSQQSAFKALATPRQNAVTVERYYRAAKRLQKFLIIWTDARKRMTATIETALRG